jgi:hypothetical protein
MKSLKDKIGECVMEHIKENGNKKMKSIWDVMEAIVYLISIIEVFYEGLCEKGDKLYPNGNWEKKGIFRSQARSAKNMLSDMAGMISIHRKTMPEEI